MVVLATIEQDGKEEVVGMGQYIIDEKSHTAEVAFVTLDAYQGKGIGSELLTCLAYLAKKQGLLGFVASVLQNNKPMLLVFESMGFVVEMRLDAGTYDRFMSFKDA